MHVLYNIIITRYDNFSFVWNNNFDILQVLDRIQKARLLSAIMASLQDAYQIQTFRPKGIYR